jgi:hypothetical protein
MRKILLNSLALGALASASIAAVPSVQGWMIGPIIRDKNYWPGMRLHPSATKQGCFAYTCRKHPEACTTSPSGMDLWKEGAA